MKITINVSKIYRNVNNIFINIEKYYAEILILLVIVMLICIVVYKNENNKNYNIIEGFSRVSNFRNRKHNRAKNKDMVEGTRYDRMVNSMKLLDENKDSSDSFLGELFTNIKLNDDEDDLNKKIKYNKNGSKASMKNVKNNIIEYYNHFDQEKFSKKQILLLKVLENLSISKKNFGIYLTINNLFLLIYFYLFFLYYIINNYNEYAQKTIKKYKFKMFKFKIIKKHD